MFVHLTLVPYIPSAGELKTKPTQHSVKELLNVGIHAADAVVPLRSSRSPKPSGARSRCSAMCARKR